MVQQERKRPSRRARAVAAFALAFVGVAAVELATSRPVEARPAPAAPVDDLAFLQDTLGGRSGKLRARILAIRPLTFPFLRRLLGDSADRPGVYTVRPREDARPFSFISLVPFHEKVNGRIGRYRIGFWPAEKGRSVRGEKYGNPQGFIEVTPENKDTRVSEHFKLADFLTHDQVRVWPKYLVLDEALVDKLELVLADLRSRGYDARRLHVMSGFRTPQYNAGGGETAGRADLSRHQYGDAADVWVENGAGRMADLNRDGRVDTRDAAILAEAADRVERAHPELAGGVGIYRSTRAHGPFVHIDTRGARARWGHG
ncbi:D-Ala-D-Ala carboxypeptidase family metallohydrolase [Roseisolibacter sp. H3M3-2]|uniref:D-Ala-D-Ala carboxypeptidase family metallohydrolase n=1 Tax=Roseisolibacter sp. H3M3-2 TaxID=3031323 RepID=UPI0023DB2C79|nr:D-Ala-D-Ala carboxypeptidase family metallohydrolase [Roseisolibacter sp. H3M3-2]MDF1503365.1 D-Ala-D-Ala carboxypeptidase family metallohydrolase [Roseisolibacter sp. H3M3-2]